MVHTTAHKLHTEMGVNKKEGTWNKEEKQTLTYQQFNVIIIELVTQTKRQHWEVATEHA